MEGAKVKTNLSLGKSAQNRIHNALYQIFSCSQASYLSTGYVTYIMVKLYKGKLSRNDNDEKKNCGRNHSQKSSPSGMHKYEQCSDILLN